MRQVCRTFELPVCLSMTRLNAFSSPYGCNNSFTCHIGKQPMHPIMQYHRCQRLNKSQHSM